MTIAVFASESPLENAPATYFEGLMSDEAEDCDYEPGTSDYMWWRRGFKDRLKHRTEK